MMTKRILINDYPIEAEELEVSIKSAQKKVSLVFQVTHTDYHDITTLLYQNDFMVDIPEQQLRFPAMIQNYSTSIDNLYQENTVGIFRLELIEKMT